MYLVDGHNLIPKIKKLSLKMMDDENALIELLNDFARLARKNVEVYFDKAAIGQSGTRKIGIITAHFIREGSTADEAIIQRVRKMKKRARDIKVVSSDRHVQNQVRAYQAEVIPSETFAKEIEKVFSAGPGGGKPDPDKQNPSEIAYWEQEFTRARKKK